MPWQEHLKSYDIPETVYICMKGDASTTDLHITNYSKLQCFKITIYY